MFGVELDLVEAFKDGSVSVQSLAALLASKLEEG